MGVNIRMGTQGRRGSRSHGDESGPPGNVRFQFGLKHLLAAPVWLALLLGAALQFGFAGTALFLLANVFAIGISRRSWAWIASGILLTLLLSCVVFRPAGARTPSRRLTCRTHLRTIALALQAYHHDFGCFPPAYIADENGRPMHSWRVLILPYVEMGPLFDRYRFDEPWNGPNNRKLAEFPWDLHICPSNPGQPATTTSYLAIVGPDTVWPGATSVRLDDVTDGPENTILLVEVKDSGIHWMEPRDLHVLQMAPTINPKAGQGISSLHQGGANVGFADGDIRFLSETISPDELRALLTIGGREPVDWTRIKE